MYKCSHLSLQSNNIVHTCSYCLPLRATVQSAAPSAVEEPMQYCKRPLGKGDSAQSCPWSAIDLTIAAVMNLAIARKKKKKNCFMSKKAKS